MIKKILIATIIVIAAAFLFPKPGDEYSVFPSAKWNRGCNCVGIKLDPPGPITGIYKSLCLGIPFYYDKLKLSENIAPDIPSGTITRQYEEGVDYSIDYPKDFFDEGPISFEVACDLAKGCPLVATTTSSRFLISMVEPVKEGDLCVQYWGSAALGTVYGTYTYAQAVPGSLNRCAVLRFTKGSVSSCSVFEEDAAAVKSCEAEIANARVIMDRAVSSWKINQPSK